METSPTGIGVVGLGIMGSAYARNLLNAGFEVFGFDIADEQMKRLEDAGGVALDSPADIVTRCGVVLVALASPDALNAVTTGKRGLCHGDGSEVIVCEMSTLSLDIKEAARTALAAAGARMLDCPVSGTGAQAVTGDISIYASGERSDFEKARRVFDGIARDVRLVGPFGTGMKLKYVANLLVAINNLATAEALLMAKQSGLDLDMVLHAVRAGAGNSRIFELRGPLMVERRYRPATMKMEVFMKDLRLISDHAEQIDCPTPLLSASLPHYSAAMDQGRDSDDTAALFDVLLGLVESR